MADGSNPDIRIDINMTETHCDAQQCLKAELTSIYFRPIWDELRIWEEYLSARTAGDTQFIGLSAKQHRQRFIVCSPAWVFKLKSSFSDA